MVFTRSTRMKRLAYLVITLFMACELASGQTPIKSNSRWPRPIPARIRDNGNKDLMVMSLGDVHPSIADGTFDPVKDEVRLNDGSTVKNYYRDTLKIKYF